MQYGHDRRYEIFKEQESAFWNGYCQYCIDNWRDAVNELNKEEILAGYKALILIYLFEPIAMLKRCSKPTKDKRGKIVFLESSESLLYLRAHA